MPNFKTYRVGKNFVTIDSDVEIEPLLWDEVFEISESQAMAIQAGFDPINVLHGEISPQVIVDESVSAQENNE